MQVHDEMVESGVDYIGTIPSSWNLSPASMLFSENKRSNKELESKIPLQFKLGEIIQKKVDVDESILEDIRRYTVVNKNDIMLNGLNLNYDFATQRVAVVKSAGCITPAYISLRTRQNYLSAYANYLLKALDGQKVLNGWGTGIRLTLNYTEFKKYRLPEPSLQVQQRIADFLDVETAKIDNLITKQEQLLKLLEEKRRATITRAVTRGLDPHVEQKETSTPWLNSIPTHWTIRKLGSLTRLVIGSTPSTQNSADFDGDQVWITIADMKSKVIRGSKQMLTRESIKAKNMEQVPKGSLLFSFKLSVGKVGYAATDLYTNEAIAAFLPNDKVLAEFLYYAAQIYFVNEANTNIYGAPLFNQELLKRVRVTYPGFKEQQDIASFLDEQDIKADNLKQKIQTQITLLRERRTSLISHAVTGKVKV